MLAFFLLVLVLVFSVLIGAPGVDAFVAPSSPSCSPAGVRIGNTLVVATFKKDYDSGDSAEAARHVSADAITDAQQRNQVGVERRGALMSLLGSAVTFAASDALLGAAGNILSGGKAVAISSSSGIYGARWNALYQRLASLTAKHEAALASPELLSWIAKSPAAFANPELRAWMAAQRALSKSHQVLRMATMVEEGLAAAGAAAAATVVSKHKGDVKSESDGGVETTVASTTPLEATNSKSEMSVPVKILPKTDEESSTATTTLKVSSE